MDNDVIVRILEADAVLVVVAGFVEEDADPVTVDIVAGYGIVA